MIAVIKKINTCLFFILIITLLYFLSSNLKADTLDEILNLTFSTNKQLILSRTKLQSSKKSIDIAKSALGINISASFSGSKSWDINQSSNSDNYSSSLIGSYNLLDGNFAKNRILIEEARFKIAKFQLYELEQKVLLDTINSYLNVLRDQKFIELSKNNVAVLTRQFLEITDRFKLGEVTTTDVSQAESALASAKANLTAQKGSLKFSEETFLSLVGIEPGNLENINPVFKLPENIENTTKTALRSHPKILVTKIEEEIEKINVEIAKSKKLPTLNLNSIFSNGYSSISGNSNSFALRLEGSIPIFSSGKIENEISQAEINYSAQKESSLIVKRSVEQEIALAWSNVFVSKASIDARKRQVQASKLAYDGVAVEEKLGTRTTLDVINAEQNLLDARTQLASSEREHIYAMFSLLAATGELNLKRIKILVPK